MHRSERPITILAGIAAIGAAGMLPSACLGRIWDVNVFNFDFSVNPIGQPIVDPTIELGDTVRWTLIQSPGGAFHDITSVIGIPEEFTSRRMTDIGQTFEHTFTHLGSWWYYCSPHGFDRGDGTAGGMAGVIHVVPGPGVCATALAAGMAIGMKRRRR